MDIVDYVDKISSISREIRSRCFRHTKETHGISASTYHGTCVASRAHISTTGTYHHTWYVTRLSSVTEESFPSIAVR